MTQIPQSIDAVETMLAGQGYVASRALATVVFLSLKLGRPLFLEGEAGTGKTEIAKTLAAALGRRLIRRLRGQSGPLICVSRAPRPAVNRALSQWKDLTAPRPVTRSGMSATGV